MPFTIKKELTDAVIMIEGLSDFIDNTDNGFTDKEALPKIKNNGKVSEENLSLKLYRKNCYCRFAVGVERSSLLYKNICF